MASNGAQACLACRRIKVKCIIQDGEATCRRCERKSLDCIYRPHQRGRKPGTRISKKIRTRPANQEIHQSPNWETGALQPSSLLDHAVSHGQFSLRNVLSTPGPATRASSGEPSSYSAGDPIASSLVSFDEASALFDSFMVNLNPYISQLDPQLHTLGHVRQKSAFLLSAILAVAAKTFHTPPLYERLLSHAEGLLSDSFIRGLKSTETAQAAMILTYWKKPEDSRAWTFLGYAVRMGMELGWHRLGRFCSADAASMSREQRLEGRNIERTWYVLFVYDRSMSLQTAKPCMIERSDFTESIEAWCKEPLAVPGDILLGAFVTLRLLTSEVFKLLGGNNHGSGSGGRSGQFYPLCSFFAIIKGRIAEWESKWTQRTGVDCYQFLIRFYAAHLRLQMFSIPLHEVLGGRNKDSSDQQQQDISFNLEALWTSYSSAIAMLHLLCRYSSCIHLAQDSIHVMTAYSVTFLVRLLLCTPAPDIVAQIQPEIESAIRQAAECFREKANMLPEPSTAAPTSCSLEAGFLEKILAKFVDARRHSTGESEEQRRRRRQAGSERVQRYESAVAFPTQHVDASPASAPGLVFDDTFAGLDGLLSEDAFWGGGILADAWVNLQEGAMYA